MLATRRYHRRIRLNRTPGLSARACRLVAAGVLAILAFGLFLLADASGAVPPSLSPVRAVAVHSQPNDTPTTTPTPTLDPSPNPTPTNTIPATPPSITIVSPASGTGPVGAHVTISGSNFTGASTRLFGSSQSDCSQSDATLATVNASGGDISETFIWPVSFAVGTYYVCANGMTDSSASYQVLTSVPPTLSLSTLAVEVGQPLTVQGSNFVGLAAGAAVSLTEQAGGAGTLQTLPVDAVVDSNGGFSVTWTVQATETGAATIRAYAGFVGSSPAALQASASVTIQPAATATATVAVTPTAAATAVAHSGTTAPPSSGNSANPIGLIILLVTGIIISMLAIVGIVVYLIRRRVPGSGLGPEPGYNGYSDPAAPQSPYGRGPAGLFLGWEDPDSGPGPDWQPRPMSGYFPEYDSTQLYPHSSRYDPTDGQTSRQQAPQDPWHDPPPGYGTYSSENAERRMRTDVPPNPDDDQWPDLGDNSWG